MTLPKGRQFQFVVGKWWDVWNDLHDEQPLPDYLAEVGETWPVAILTQDFCGCHDWPQFINAMAAYLRDLTSVDWDDLGSSLVAALADSYRLTEHGTSIAFPWVTDAGKRWLHLYDRDAPGGVGIPQ